MWIRSITDLAWGGYEWNQSFSLSLSLFLPPSAQSSFLPFLFPPFAGLSFVKLDNLVPSLRAITLDYFCLQSCAPPYTYSLEMIGVELEKENNAWGRAGRTREREISQQEEEGIAERSDDWASISAWLLGCVPGEPKDDFVRMLAQIQIGELGVENDSAKESSIEIARERCGRTILSI